MRVFWTVLVTIVVTAWSLYFIITVTRSEPHARAPEPVPFSCAQLASEAAVADSGGQVAPVCGQSPYAQTPGNSSGS